MTKKKTTKSAKLPAVTEADWGAERCATCSGAGKAKDGTYCRCALGPVREKEDKAKGVHPDQLKASRPKSERLAPVVALALKADVAIECHYKGGAHKATLHPDGTVSFRGKKVGPAAAMKEACGMSWSPMQQTAWRAWRIAEGELKGRGIGDVRKDGAFALEVKPAKPEPKAKAKAKPKAKKKASSRQQKASA